MTVDGTMNFLECLKWNEGSKVMSFPSYKAHGPVLVSVFLALSQTPVYTASHCTVPVYGAVPAFTGTHCTNPWMVGQAELTWVAGYIPDGLPVCRWSPIQVLTPSPALINFVDTTNDVTN